jgi:hypothetical protein
MDNWLASIYGTNAATDIEKTAQHNLLQKLAEEEGIDLSGMSDDELSNLYAQVSGDDGAGAVDEGTTVEQPGAADPAALEAEAVKLAQEKFEEADFLGRVMAHAYNQELEKIAQEKTAGTRGAWKGVEAAGKAGKAIGSAAKGAFGAAKGKAQSIGGHMKAHTAPGSSSKVRGAMDHGLRNKERYAVGAGAAAAGVGAKKAFGGKNKEASAFEKLAELRAGELLGAAGVTPDMHNQVMQQRIMQEQAARQQQAQQPQNPMAALHPAFAEQPGQEQPGVEQEQPAGDEQFNGALDERALQLLAEAGYNVDALVEQLTGGQGGEEGQQAQGQPGQQPQRPGQPQQGGQSQGIPSQQATGGQDDGAQQ